ncbi:Stk1 family PASTA domain-containing Ser/Thr kinase [Metabacillus sediminilitoris]|uniref:Serine/threonine-protein kinase PrkC n=1 Tax=Metabacillus sediminilitoris TaxID=2567941 RepID=A0A4S4C5E5_9BACI|nr:Stk1 family PASTA domain-containing Ser/Thr kinase [Metabacillus sediminilitoris]QGQ46901.1 Stk1 family PASTA domain-containing Ser/Thr kinase [Metabacillus sediminilitoris]THF83049.1 Stk1 family PASTA domain-containing Ser/Thr kinase [Metabacillus sediminilitoris]
MLIGKRISGRYKILEVIGGGGMANVYLARDMILERDVAMKVLRFDFSNDDEFIKRFRREAQSATSLAHPNVVSIYDVGEEDNIYYIVMEYVEGQTLKQYIQQFAPVHPRKAVNIMEQIVSGIQHAHDNQIIHRDIKPHNILIDHNGNVKVTDFGIAMALSSTTITQTNSVLGSVHYLSPEQARGGLANKKSDIYSLGIVLFEMLTGRLPFDGESAISIALKHLQSETPSAKRWNPDIPQSLENIILKATAKDPFHRYQSADEMEEDLETVFDVSRLTEPRFSIPEDDEVTKAIPIITNENINRDKIDDTIVHAPENDDIHKSTNKQQKNQKIKKEKKKKKPGKNKLAIILITTFFILLAAGVSAFTIVPPLLLPKDIEVPDVSGKSYDDAVDILTEKGFEIDEPVRVSDEKIEEGYVIKTNPSANEITKEGATITIYESTGKEKIVLEDYVGRNIDRVKAILEMKGFKNIDVKPESNETQAAGTILTQFPEIGEEVIPTEETIEFTVSTGPKQVAINELVGKSKEEIDEYVSANGFITSVSEEHSSDIPKGHLVSQSPEPGTKVVPRETTLQLVYSSGPEELPRKTVTKTVDIPYNPEIVGQEQEVSILIDDAEHSISDTYKTFKISSPKVETLNFTIESGQVAYYQIIIDNEVVTSETIPYPND